MIPALLTALLFSLSAVAGRRLAESIGGLRANSTRLSLAFVLLLSLFLLKGGWGSVEPAVFWLGVSGVIGFGIGDVALYLALVQIGSRLTTLLVFCVGPFVGAGMEYFWMGQRIGGGEWLGIVAILIGVGLVLRPDQRRTKSIGWIGVMWGGISGLAQAVGAVFSRKANTLLPEDAGGVWEGIFQAGVRVGAGLPIALLTLWVVTFWKRRRDSESAIRSSDEHRQPWITRWRPLFPWLFGAAFCGPVIGVGCFQWALFELSSGNVLAVVALVPILVMPWSYFLEKDRPSGIALLGTGIAVAGMAGLALISG